VALVMVMAPPAALPPVMALVVAPPAAPLPSTPNSPSRSSTQLAAKLARKAA
jgi:hypothetical protein